MVGGQRADLGDEFLADIFGDGFAVHLGGQMPAALGGVLVERALQQVQGVVDLPFKLFLPEQQVFALFAHEYAYNYAYFKA